VHRAPGEPQARQLRVDVAVRKYFKAGINTSSCSTLRGASRWAFAINYLACELVRVLHDAKEILVQQFRGASAVNTSFVRTVGKIPQGVLAGMERIFAQ